MADEAARLSQSGSYVAGLRRVMVVITAPLPWAGASAGWVSVRGPHPDMRAPRPVTGARASACRLALVRGNVTLHGGRGCASASSGHDTFASARRSTST
jgi:hypothetical protein